MKRIFICEECGNATIEGEEANKFADKCNAEECEECGSSKVRIFVAAEVNSTAEADFIDFTFSQAKSNLDG